MRIASSETKSELSEERSKQPVGLNTFVIGEILVNFLFKEEG